MAKEFTFDDMTGMEKFWYVLYVIVNIFTLGAFWFVRNLITISIKKAR